MTDHKATPEQWAYAEEWAAEKYACYSCIIELRARVEALECGKNVENLQRLSDQLLDRLVELEADQWLRQHAKPKPEPALAAPLVERVARAIGRDDEPIHWEPEARAAIREVAAWLRSRIESVGAMWMRDRLLAIAAELETEHG
jgi:hypothetical protein